MMFPSSIDACAEMWKTIFRKTDMKVSRHAVGPARTAKMCYEAGSLPERFQCRIEVKMARSDSLFTDATGPTVMIRFTRHPMSRLFPRLFAVALAAGLKGSTEALRPRSKSGL